MERARLTRYGLLSVTGEDAREFLHAQLTNDVLHLPADRAVPAGWCTAKGRLLATFLVIPSPDGFLLQLARDIAASVAKRMAMFVLRSKVRVSDESGAWHQAGAWGEDRGGPDVQWHEGRASVRVAPGRYLEISREERGPFNADETAWTVQEILAGRPLVTSATQDLFVPQMLNLERLGAVDFQKGCYPGQEIVARAQYRGEVKRRLVHRRAPPGAEPRPGQELDGGVVVDSAGGEMLVVMPV